MENFGVQLYSYTRDCDIGFLDRIKTSGEIGYNLVEFAGGYDDIPVETVKKTLEEAGVKVLSAHVPLQKLDEQLEYLAELGVKYMIVPGAPFCTKAEAKELADELNAFGKKAAKLGVKTGYHNHTFEFFKDEEKYILDWLIEFTDPETVVFELDCGWVSSAGVDPVEYINANKGRIAAIHIKENAGVTGVDMPASRNNTEPKEPPKRDANGDIIISEEEKARRQKKHDVNVKQGEGTVDWKGVKAAADAQWDGEVLYVVERESSYNDPKDRVACLREDAQWVKANL